MGRIKKFNEQVENFIYLLSSDGHRDSVSLEKGSIDIDSLKKLLIEEYKEYTGGEIIFETIKVEDKGSYGTLYFKYKDMFDEGEIEDGRYGFFKLKIV